MTDDKVPHVLGEHFQIGECKVLLLQTRQWGLMVKSWKPDIEWDSQASGSLFLCLFHSREGTL